MDDIADLLKESLGLDVASVGRPAIDRAVASRMSACELSDAGEYGKLVRASRQELQALTEAVVVPETWFFRDAEAFAVLVRDAVEERRTVGRVMRVLSLPSSTGEEPYSIAMALLDAGLSRDAFHVDAFDVSAVVIARATEGRYGRNSFRGRDLEFRSRHFEQAGSEWRLSERVRKQVTFKQGNLFAIDSLVASTLYDAVFCRNLMIYFDRDTQDRAVRTLGRHLAPEGLLFVAPCEAAIVLNHPFTPLKVKSAFAFRQSTGERRPAKPLRPAVVSWAPEPRRVPPSVRLDRVVAPAAPPEPTRAVDAASDADAMLAEAARLANEGHLADASTRCEALIKRFGPSVGAFYLMGTISDAAGRAGDAVAWYRKALYLDPHHHEVLVHLALILETLGEHAESRRLRDRAARSTRRSGHQHDARA